MKLLYISSFSFIEKDGDTYALPSCHDAFFEKYLDIFDFVTVIGCKASPFMDISKFRIMTNPRIKVTLIEENEKPTQFLNDKIVSEKLSGYIRKADAILIKPNNRKGIMAIRLAKKYHKPYMLEFTGDNHNALKQSEDWKRRFYAPILYFQIKRAIKDCKFGLYVSQEYLQSQYPISGEMCGCSDVILEKANDSILSQRINKINAMKVGARVDIALIGFYQGFGKGVDTAIRALSRLPENFHLNILGNGTEKSRNKWFEYGAERGVFNRIHFPEPLGSPTEVLKWLDTQDIFILPTRSEGFGRVVAEAMSRGCICFATNICTMPELHELSCLHPLGDDEKLAELIKSYTSDKNKMVYMAKRNFEKAKEYDFDILKTRRNAFLSRFRDYCLTYNCDR